MVKIRSGPEKLTRTDRLTPWSAVAVAVDSAVPLTLIGFSPVPVARCPVTWGSLVLVDYHGARCRRWDRASDCVNGSSASRDHCSVPASTSEWLRLIGGGAIIGTWRYRVPSIGLLTIGGVSDRVRADRHLERNATAQCHGMQPRTVSAAPGFFCDRRT
jgi:hypothetical protein